MDLKTNPVDLATWDIEFHFEAVDFTFDLDALSFDPLTTWELEPLPAWDFEPLPTWDFEAPTWEFEALPTWDFGAALGDWECDFNEGVRLQDADPRARVTTEIERAVDELLDADPRARVTTESIHKSLPCILR